MFIRRSTYNQLIARAETFRQAELNARRTVTTLVGNSARAAEQFVDADDRTNAVEKELDEAKATIADRDKRIKQLQARLDDALGLNDPVVMDGALWQERRHDKPRPVKP